MHTLARMRCKTGQCHLTRHNRKNTDARNLSRYTDDWQAVVNGNLHPLNHSSIHSQTRSYHGNGGNPPPYRADEHAIRYPAYHSKGGHLLPPISRSTYTTPYQAHQGNRGYPPPRGPFYPEQSIHFLRPIDTPDDAYEKHPPNGVCPQSAEMSMMYRFYHRRPPFQ